METIRKIFYLCAGTFIAYFMITIGFAVLDSKLGYVTIAICHICMVTMFLIANYEIKKPYDWKKEIPISTQR